MQELIPIKTKFLEENKQSFNIEEILQKAFQKNPKKKGTFINLLTGIVALPLKILKLNSSL